MQGKGCKISRVFYQVNVLVNFSAPAAAATLPDYPAVIVQSNIELRVKP